MTRQPVGGLDQSLAGAASDCNAAVLPCACDDGVRRGSPHRSHNGTLEVAAGNPRERCVGRRARVHGLQCPARLLGFQL
jgi:hypothetical protein